MCFVKFAPWSHARRIFATSACMFGALLVGCATPYSSAPTAVNFPSSKQAKLQAALHWQAIGRDLADALVVNIHQGKVCGSPAGGCDRYYVREQKNPSPFAQALRGQLISSLLSKGINLVKSPVGANEIDIEVQSLRFNGGRSDGKFTSATAIYAGLWGLHGIWQSATPAVSGLAAVGAIDAARWMSSEFAEGAPPQHEIIVTLSASNGDRYLGRSSNVYYLADGDEMLYQERSANHTISVTGGR